MQSSTDNVKPWSTNAKDLSVHLSRHRELVIAVWNGVLLFQRPWLSLIAFTGLNGALWVMTQSRIPIVSLAAISFAGYIFSTEKMELSLTKCVAMLDISNPLQDISEISDSIAKGWYYLISLPSMLQIFKERNPSKYMPVISAVAMEIFLLGFLVPGYLVFRALIYSLCMAPAINFYCCLDKVLEIYEASTASGSEEILDYQRNVTPKEVIDHSNPLPENISSPPTHSTSSATTPCVSDNTEVPLTSTLPETQLETTAASQILQEPIQETVEAEVEAITTAVSPIVTKSEHNQLDDEHDSLSESEWEKDFVVSRPSSPHSTH